MAPKIHFGQDAFLIHTNSTHVLVGTGPSFMDVELAATITPDDVEEKRTIRDIVIHKKKDAILVQLPDNKICYITGAIDLKKAKEYRTDVLVLGKPNEQLITKLQPKLCVLMNSTVYTARELHHKTGVQVIAVQHGTTIDLNDYNAVSKQKGLSQFTKGT